MTAVVCNAQGAAGLAFDADGNLFLLGANPSTSFKFSPTGQVTTFAKAKEPGEDWMGLAIDRHGNVFTAGDASALNGDVIVRILKFTPTGKRNVYVANLGKGQPKTLAFDDNGNLFVGDFAVEKWSSDTIYKITPNAQRSIFSKAVSDPTFFAPDHKCNLFVYDESRKISKLGP